MLVNNKLLQTEGIAGKTFQLHSGKTYAFSFFLSSSEISNYFSRGGYFNLKIYLSDCQNFGDSSTANPLIVGDKQLIFCKAFENVTNSNWQQYFITFTADDDYDMIVIAPEISNVIQDGGSYLHFLYPELIPINPTHQHITYTDESPESISTSSHYTILSACGLTNGTYKWEGTNGIVSTQASDVLDFGENPDFNTQYDFTIRVEGALGNNIEMCSDAETPIISSPAIRLTSIDLVSCGATIVKDGCNFIPNSSFIKHPGNASNIDAFRLNRIDDWGSVNGGTPDLNGAWIPGIPLPIPPFPTGISSTTNVAGIVISTWHTGYFYEGIYAKIPQLISGNKYAFSFFLNTLAISDEPADFTFNVALSNCQVYPITPFMVGTTSPPNFTSRLAIICQKFNGVETTGWQQYFVTFTADANYDMMVIYPQGNLNGSGESYIHFLMPELIDVTNLITVTETAPCNYSLQACGVTNARYEWKDGNNTVIGNTPQINIDATVNPEFYSLTLSVPDILNNPILDNSCSQNTETIISQAFGSLARWNGSVSEDWNNPANWNSGVVPNNSFTDVNIPLSVPRYPTISGSQTFQVHSINIALEALLTNNGTLKIAKDINAGGSAITNYDTTALSGSIEMNGPCMPQTIDGSVFQNNAVKNFTASNNITISSATGNELNVYRELSFGTALNKTLNTGDNLVLKSNATSTANVAKIDGTNFIDGKVTVEMYINTGQGNIANDHFPKWQMLSTPTGANAIGQTVKQSWMENGLITITPNGYGTNIPDPRPNWDTLGFDQQSANGNTVIKTYNPTTNGFDPIANTDIPLYNKKGYFLFVRGDRSAAFFTSPPVPTNLRSKGSLFQPNTHYAPPSIIVPATSPSGPSKFEMVGNPYASPISIEEMKNNGNFINLTNNVIVWDPLLSGLGGYQTLHASTGYKPTPGGTALYDAVLAYPDIQSGQAFYVGTLPNSTTGLVTFDEAIKSTNYRLVTRQSVIAVKSFKANLYYRATICDGNAVLFENNFTNETDADDAGKFLNPGENFMIRKTNTFLAVETRRQVEEKDSVHYAFSNLRKGMYQLRFMPENLQEEGLYAVLIDHYLHQQTVISLSENSLLDFTVDESKASYENRFVLVFHKQTKKLPAIAGKITYTYGETGEGSVNIYPNPAWDKTINIHFSHLQAGVYKIQLMNQAGQILYNSRVKIKEKEGLQVIKPGKHIPSGSYQIMIVAENGKKYSQQFIYDK